MFWAQEVQSYFRVLSKNLAFPQTKYSHKIFNFSLIFVFQQPLYNIQNFLIN